MPGRCKVEKALRNRAFETHARRGVNQYCCFLSRKTNSPAGRIALLIFSNRVCLQLQSKPGLFCFFKKACNRKHHHFNEL